MNININMGEVLTKAWQITWKFKVLWIFGILAGCGENNRASFNNSFGISAFLFVFTQVRSCVLSQRCYS